MAKKRVHEIAKERGITSKEALEVLRKAGLEVKVAASSVEEEDAARAFGNGAERAPGRDESAQAERRPSPAKARRGEGRQPGRPDSAATTRPRRAAEPRQRARRAAEGASAEDPDARSAERQPAQAGAGRVRQRASPGGPSGGPRGDGGPRAGRGSRGDGRARRGGGGGGGRRRVVIDSQAARRDRTPPPPQQPPRRGRGRRRRPLGRAGLEAEAQARLEAERRGARRPGAVGRDRQGGRGVARQLASPEVIKKLMELGEMATLTQTLSDEAIQVLAEAFDKKVEIVPPPRRSRRSPSTRTGTRT